MDDWIRKSEDLQSEILARNFWCERAREYAVHGFSRRMSYLRHAMERIFELLPLDADNPDRLTLNDTTLFLHAFVLNIHGALDNLAHMWVKERGLTKSNGNPFADNEIGLLRRNKVVRNSIREAEISDFTDFDKWLNYFQTYRDSLAHRIPLYIPPKLLNNSAVEEFRRIEKALSLAIQCRDFDEWGRLMKQQNALGRFEAWMVHSLDEGAVPMRFHAQMICDFATVVDWGQRLIAKL